MKEHATYRIGNAIAVTQRLDDGTWMATFPGCAAFGAAESDALRALAAEVEGAAKRLHLQAIEVAGVDDPEPLAVIIRTYATSGRLPGGDVCGQIVNAETGEILHESMFWPTGQRKAAIRDAEQIANRRGYRVVEVSE